ncbi:MAG: hypothetical protein AAF456_22000, partial [Planctomycetota bacterium]
IALKHTVEQKGPSAGSAIAHLILHMFLGPVGWVISAVTAGNSGDDKTRQVKKTKRVTISQCRLCNGTEIPEVTASRLGAKEYKVPVHPEFARRLLEERNKVEPDQLELPWQ